MISGGVQRRVIRRFVEWLHNHEYVIVERTGDRELTQAEAIEGFCQSQSAESR